MSRLVSPAFRVEVLANLRLALPLIAAQIAAVGMGTIDTIYAGQVGPQALAAVAVAVNVYNLFLIFFMGLLMACSPIAAQMFGARRPAAAIGGFLRRSQRFGVISGLVWTGLLNLVGPIMLRQLNLSAATTHDAIVFLRWFSCAGLMTSIWFVLRFAAEGLGQVRPIVIAGLIGLAANALFGWLLVFGHGGLPKLGINGLGLASTLATALMVAVLRWQYTRVPSLHAAMMASRDAAAAAGEGARDILKLGLPIAAIITAEGGLFVLMALLMARFGEATVASYQVAINFSSLVFMIPLGVGMATTVRVGHAAGAGDHAAARWRGLVGLSLGTVNAASNAAIMLLFAGLIVSFYTTDAVIAAQAVGFLLISAAFQLFDGVQATANGALRGLKDTRMPMLLTLVSYWGIGMPVAWWLAFHLGHGPDGLWWGLTAGLAAAAVGLTLRFAYKSAKLVRHAVPAVLAEA
ncbi:MATE family efflux transporter [Nevskia sp.]|uniref:MATE family efflux transporter n=1 Tax=Nevskia sp. TaxID=1929292 RepID=UPI0025D053C8|nr:MATE family efflux transporter [Nevskia sp.]